MLLQVANQDQVYRQLIVQMEQEYRHLVANQLLTAQQGPSHEHPQEIIEVVLFKTEIQEHLQIEVLLQRLNIKDITRYILHTIIIMVIGGQRSIIITIIIITITGVFLIIGTGIHGADIITDLFVTGTIMIDSLTVC